MKKTILLITLTTLCSSLAFASGEGIYLGINAIAGNIDLQDTTVGNQTYTPDSTSSPGGGLTVGYNVSENFALDYAIDGFDQIDYSGDNAPNVSYWFTYLAAKPMLNIWKFNVFVEAGAAYVSFTQHNPDDVENTEGSGVRPFGGAGIGFNFSPNSELALSINRIEDTNTPITFGMLTWTYHFTERYEDSGFLAD